MEQSLSPSAHLQHPVGAEAPVVGNSWRTLASGEALELGGMGRTRWLQGCGLSVWVSLRIRGDVDQWGFQCSTRTSSRENWGLLTVLIPGLFSCSLVLIQVLDIILGIHQIKKFNSSVSSARFAPVGNTLLGTVGCGSDPALMCVTMPGAGSPNTGTLSQPYSAARGMRGAAGGPWDSRAGCSAPRPCGCRGAFAT